MRPKLLERLIAGGAVALVSDAGTPLISDPGFKLVRAARDAGHAVTAAPGASAVMAALAGAGLPTDRFFFEGFLPAKGSARRARIAELAATAAGHGFDPAQRAGGDSRTPRAPRLNCVYEGRARGASWAGTGWALVEP